MKAIRNIKIRAKLCILCGIGLIGMLAIGIVSFCLMNSLNGISKEISEVWLTRLNETREMDTVTSDYRLNQLRYLIPTSTEYQNEASENLSELKSKMNTLLLTMQMMDRGFRRKKKLYSQMCRAIGKNFLIWTLKL